MLNADNLLNNPDFRSAERAFQLLMQVAGRAGRRENPGTVVIQTAEPGHPVLQQVIAGDYEAMARQQARRAEGVLLSALCTAPEPVVASPRSRDAAPCGQRPGRRPARTVRATRAGTHGPARRSGAGRVSGDPAAEDRGGGLRWPGLARRCAGFSTGWSKVPNAKALRFSAMSILNDIKGLFFCRLSVPYAAASCTRARVLSV